MRTCVVQRNLVLRLPRRLHRQGDVRTEGSPGRTSEQRDVTVQWLPPQPSTYLSPSSAPEDPRLWRRGQSSLPAARPPRRPRRPPNTHAAMHTPLAGVDPARLPSRSRGYSTFRQPRHRSTPISIGPWLSGQGGTLPGSRFLLVCGRSWAGKP